MSAQKESVMRRHSWMRALAFFVFTPVILAVLSLIVMLLWNALVPKLFSGPVLAFWQAVGLLVLCGILFGGFRGRGGPHGWKDHPAWRDRWHRMTPGERERVREGLRRWRPMSREERQFRTDLRGIPGPLSGDCPGASSDERA